MLSKKYSFFGLKKVIIIAVSAHALESQRKKAIEFGMDDFITKPFSQAELKASTPSLSEMAVSTIEAKAAPNLLQASAWYVLELATPLHWPRVCSDLSQPLAPPWTWSHPTLAPHLPWPCVCPSYGPGLAKTQPWTLPHPAPALSLPWPHFYPGSGTTLALFWISQASPFRTSNDGAPRGRPKDPLGQKTMRGSIRVVG